MARNSVQARRGASALLALLAGTTMLCSPGSAAAEVAAAEADSAAASAAVSDGADI
ncbi:MAG: hypothetical protein JWM75_2523, partial [Sphingomonas bacterium]|nr:hypothetical protein [Sphingomonas bacterium]